MSDTPYGKRGTGRAVGQVQVHAGHSGSHSYDEEEKVAFVDWINDVLADDPLCAPKLPISIEGDEFFTAVHDGILLCKLINDAVPDTIDDRAINTKKLSTFTKHENQTLAINSAKGIGCSVVNIGPKDLMDGTKHLILGLVWQIVKIGLLSKINLTVHPELYRLLQPGETLEDLLKLPAEQLLLRWVNYQLAQAGSNKRIKNFQGDIADSEAYSILLKQIGPARCGVDMSAMNESDKVKRADKMLQQADKLDCRKFVRPKDVVNGVPKLNLAFVANLFNHYPALDPVEEEIKIIEETREEKSFRNWMNSLGVDPYVDSVPLYLDLQDGLIILQVMDKVDPGCVDWNNRVTRNFSRIGAKAKMEKLENCNYAVELAKKHFNFSVVGIDGNDIREGKPMMVLSILWQLMRRNVLNILHDIAAKKGKTGKIEEHEIIEWANNKLSGAGKSSSFRSFSDPCLGDSTVMLDLIDAIRPGSVNYDLILSDGSEQSLEKNAKLCITLARKIGAVVFALPEDIIESNKKMCMTVFASLMAVDLS